MTDDIASLRASVERLTRERDEAIGALGLAEKRVTMLLGVERIHVQDKKWLHELVGLDTSGDFDPDALPDRLRELVATEQAWEAEHGPDGRKSAEATIARLAAVVRAANGVVAAAQVGPCGFHCPPDCRVMSEVVSPIVFSLSSLSSLSPDDRRRAGIEG